MPKNRVNISNNELKMKYIIPIALIFSTLLTACNGVAQTESSSKSCSDPLHDRMLPATNGDSQIIVHQNYTLNYSEADEQPLWVAYMLTRKRTKGNVERTNYFFDDPDVSTGSSSWSDYKGSGYSRGHLMPAGDAKWDTAAMRESFFMSNISPQLKEFNDGIWNKLERKMRHWANIYDTIYIVTGPVLKTDGEQLRKIGHHNKVTVPNHFYKAVYCPSEHQAIGFLIPHEISEKSLQNFVVTIDQLEDFTGLDFFPELDDTLENSIESSTDLKQWRW